jgi:selenocysteine lyase/cysteine desulfurase
MYAPFGVGALVGRRDTFERGEPECRGGGTIRFVSLDAVTWGDAPDRDEAGTPNVIGAVALAAAIETLAGIGMPAVAQHEAELAAYALRGMAGIGGVRVHGDTDAHAASRRLAVIPFNVEGVPHALVAAVLAEEHGIGVRNGCFCAQPYVAHLLGLSNSALHKLRLQMANDDLSAMPGMVRASFGMYTTIDEVDRLLAALRAIARAQIGGRYALDARRGEYTLLHNASGAAAFRQPPSSNELGRTGTRTG